MSDAAEFVRLMGDPSTDGGTLQLPWPTETAWAVRLADPQAGSIDLHLVAVRHDGHIVASAGVHGMAQVRRRHVAGLGIAVNPEMKGRRLGTAVVAALGGGPRGGPAAG